MVIIVGIAMKNASTLAKSHAKIVLEVTYETECYCTVFFSLRNDVTPHLLLLHS